MRHISAALNYISFVKVESCCDMNRNYWDLALTGENMRSILDTALDEIMQNSNKDGKLENMRLLASRSSQFHYPRLSSLIHRLPTLAETCRGKSKEQLALIQILENILKDCTSDDLSNLSKVLTKFVSVITRICGYSISDAAYGTTLLLVLGQSKARSMLLPHSGAVRMMCWEIISNYCDDIELVTLAANVIAIYSSLESVESWESLFVQVIKELELVLSSIGVLPRKSERSEFCADNSLLKLVKSGEFNKIQGVIKAKVAHSLSRGLCLVISQMLTCGCATGFVAVNLAPFVSLMANTLGVTSEIDTSDPVGLIVGNYGISRMDLCLVIPLIKVDILSVVLTILDSDHPAILRIGTALVRPIASLLSRRAGKAGHLQRKLLQCIMAAARKLPSIVAISVNTAPIGVVEMLSNVMQEITSDQSLLAGSAQSSKSNDRELMTSTPSFSWSALVRSEYHEYLELVFQTCDAILLHCGALLNHTIRDAISVEVGIGLKCLSRGILPSQFTDRHLHRSSVASLRQEPFLQCLLLQLATTECFCPPQQNQQIQQYSRNLPILKFVAELCCKFAATSSVATRALVLCGVLLQPTTVALPLAPSVDASRAYIMKVNNISNVEESATMSVAKQQNPTSSLTRSDNVGDIESLGTKKRGRASNEEKLGTSPEPSEHSKRVKVSGTPVKNGGKDGEVGKLEKRSLQTTSSASESMRSTEVAQTETAESDDESLPDINIEADPDE